MSKKNIFIYFLLVVVLYIYMHNPILVPLGGIGAIKLLYLVFIAVFFFLNRSYKDVSSLFGKEQRCYLFLVIYISFRSFLYSGEIISFYTSLVLFIEDVLLPFAIICLLVRADIDFDKFNRIILIVGSAGAVISTVCLFFPSINSFVRTEIILIEEGSYLESHLYRGFGISEGLTYTYGIIQGWIFAVSLLNIRNNKWVIPFLPLMLLSVAINARTGLLVAFTGLIIFIFQGQKKSVVLIALTILLVINYLLPVFMTNADVQLLDWMGNFFIQVGTVFDERSIENTTTTINTLLDKMIILPETIAEWLFGRGYSLFHGSAFGNSDVGWILQLNRGGLIYVIGWLVLFYSLFRKLKLARMDTWQILLLLGTLVIANTKGNAFENSGAIRCLLIYMYYCIYCSYRNSVQHNS